MARVNVYQEGEVMARVRYNHDLDTWDGRNWSDGSQGHHLGLTQLQDGRFVLIYGTDWQGELNRAEIISRERAIQLILRVDDDNLLDKYGLRKEAEKALISEAE